MIFWSAFPFTSQRRARRRRWTMANGNGNNKTITLTCYFPVLFCRNRIAHDSILTWRRLLLMLATCAKCIQFAFCIHNATSVCVNLLLCIALCGCNGNIAVCSQYMRSNHGYSLKHFIVFMARMHVFLRLCLWFYPIFFNVLSPSASANFSRTQTEIGRDAASTKIKHYAEIAATVSRQVDFKHNAGNLVYCRLHANRWHSNCVLSKLLYRTSIDADSAVSIDALPKVMDLLRFLFCNRILVALICRFIGF